MSTQAVLNFMRKAQEDKALGEKVSAIKSTRVADLIEVARAAGFEFTADEFASAVSGELKDDDLGQVAGGAIYMKQPPAQTMPTDQFSLNFAKFITG